MPKIPLSPSLNALQTAAEIHDFQQTKQTLPLPNLLIKNQTIAKNSTGKTMTKIFTKIRTNWTREENEKYWKFVLTHRQRLEKTEKKYKQKIYNMMSACIGTRDKNQCRSHDQKMRKNPKNFNDFLLDLMQGRKYQTNKHAHINTNNGQNFAELHSQSEFDCFGSNDQSTQVIILNQNSMEDEQKSWSQYNSQLTYGIGQNFIGLTQSLQIFENDPKEKNSHIVTLMEIEDANLVGPEPTFFEKYLGLFSAVTCHEGLDAY